MERALGAVAEVAAGQHGVVSVSQAQAAGVDAATLARWQRRGWLRRLRRGVYVFSGAATSVWHPTVAACLAAGPGAVVSHRSAAAIHGLPGVLLPARPEITVPPGHSGRLQRVTVHRTGPVPPDQRIERRGIAVTSPVRTLIDLAPALSPALLAAVLDDGAVRRLWSFQDVAEAVQAQSRQRWGSPQLRDLLAVRGDNLLADSHLEQRVLRDLDPLRPFEVHHQVVLSGTVIVLDAAWPWWRVAAEVDGRSYRATSRAAHDRETRKLNLLAVHDWKVAHPARRCRPTSASPRCWT